MCGGVFFSSYFSRVITAVTVGNTGMSAEEKCTTKLQVYTYIYGVDLMLYHVRMINIGTYGQFLT